MARKLKISDIRKNSVLQVSHSINKIKENERKYTIILVIIFNIIFIVVGYFSLTIHENKSINNNIYSTKSITSYSKMVSLNDLDIINDDDGKNKNNYPIEIVNETNKDINYRIIFQYDTDTIEKCGCNEKMIEYDNIRYSLDGENVNQFNNKDNMIIKEDLIPAKKTKTINISMWINEKTEKNDKHLHGYFVIEKK